MTNEGALRRVADGQLRDGEERLDVLLRQRRAVRAPDEVLQAQDERRGKGERSGLRDEQEGQFKLRHMVHTSDAHQLGQLREQETLDAVEPDADEENVSEAAGQ